MRINLNQPNLKKSIISAFILGVFLLLSCSKDDDDKKAVDDCQTCNFEFLGEILISEFCDNGNGTFTITTDGESETQDLEDATFQEIIAAYEQFGATCN